MVFERGASGRQVGRVRLWIEKDGRVDNYTIRSNTHPTYGKQLFGIKEVCCVTNPLTLLRLKSIIQKIKANSGLPFWKTEEH